MKLKINSREYDVEVAADDESRRVGLLNTDKLEEGKGLLLKFDDAQHTSITMVGMKYPLDLLFILDNKVIKKVYAEPGEDDITISDNSDMVLEVNAGDSVGVRKGAKIEFIGVKNDDGTVEMAEGGLKAEGIRQVLDDKGKNQMNLLGGERIFSRIATKRMFELAKEKKYKTLGRFLYKEIKAQDSRPLQYADN